MEVLDGERSRKNTEEYERERKMDKGDKRQGAVGFATVRANTQEEFRAKLDALLGELDGFEIASISANVTVHKADASKEDTDRLIQALDRWQEQEKVQDLGIPDSKTECNRIPVHGAERKSQDAARGQDTTRTQDEP